MKNNRYIEWMETYSNLAYNLGGLLAYLIHQEIGYMLTGMLLGNASYRYHRFKTAPTQDGDWVAMIVRTGYILGVTVNNDYLWLGIIAFCIIYNYFIVGRINVYAEVGFIVLPTLISIYWYRPVEQAIWTTVIFAVAFIIRLMDKDVGQRKNHDSVAHSIWHVLTEVGYWIARFGV